jgi:multidrug transporter EmrE-like cation transporter
VLSAALLAITRDLPMAAYGPAAITGLVHVPYVACLAWAYDHGDFSVAYPIARGSGAALSALGGVVLLDDSVGPWTVVAIVVVAAGMGVLALGAHHRQVVLALFVGLTIGVYTVNDSDAVRTYGASYAFAVFVLTGLATTLLGVALGRSGAMAAAVRTNWQRFATTGVMVAACYGLVLVAVRRAPVGYVAALRESSVLIAALLGARYLAEAEGQRRTFAAAVILGGIVLLIATA